jgi:hypothetical protein
MATLPQAILCTLDNSPRLSRNAPEHPYRNLLSKPPTTSITSRMLSKRKYGTQKHKINTSMVKFENPTSFQMAESTQVLAPNT